MMSDSSDDERISFQLRDEDEDTDDEQPRKRRRTMQPALRGRGIGFTRAADEAEEDNDADDVRPSFGAFGGGVPLGEYNEEQSDDEPPSRVESPRRTPPQVTRPSAFGSSGNASKMSFAARQMAKMGYVEGKGLGARGEGIAAPIIAKGTAGRAGLGVGSASDEPKKKRIEKSKSQTSTPGSRTPVLKPRPKPKFQTVADIEAGGLKVPAALRSIIIDATGAEHKKVSSAAGFATPTRGSSPERENAKIVQRAKRDLEEFAKAWDATKENEIHLQIEERTLQADIDATQQNMATLHEVMSIFESTSSNGSEANGDVSKWSQVVTKMHKMQNMYAELIEELDLAEATAAVLEAPFKREMVDWNPLGEPDHLVQSLQSLGPLLELNKDHQRHCTPFHSLLSLHWFPQIRRTIREQWDVYDPVKAVDLIRVWKPIIPSWLYCRIIDELVMPQLISSIDSFQVGGKGKRRNKSAPPLHAWLIDWWLLLSEDDFNAPTIATLATHVKRKLDSESWPQWKPLLGKPTQARARVPQSMPTPDRESSLASDVEMSFPEQVETWAIEQGLLLESLHKADEFGRRLYRLRPENTSGVVIFMQDDVVFDSAGDPYGLDERLASRAKNRASK